MARTPLLQLSDISLTFGGDPVFDGLDLVVQPGDRVALVGRNGSGKSTLMKVMAGLVEADRGDRVLSPGVQVGYMDQHPDLSGFDTLGETLVVFTAGLGVILLLGAGSVRGGRQVEDKLQQGGAKTAKPGAAAKAGGRG